nr:DNA damage-inducible protein D [Bacilli bacterium]
MNNVERYSSKIFEDIKHVDDDGNEYWYARELQKILEYSQWRRFESTIIKARESCIAGKYNISDHFANVGKMVKIGSNTDRRLVDYKLSRYACYLIVMNGDPRKEVIALGQTYFAVQTRKQELLEEKYSGLNENEKRILLRRQTKSGNINLNRTAVKAGVKNLDRFHNAGYKGLYNGETADDIAKRKKLRYREDILDNMGSKELAANLLRITQTDETIENNKIVGEKNACDTHNKVGRIIRKAIKTADGIMPENLDCPNKSIKELEKDTKRKINS